MVKNDSHEFKPLLDEIEEEPLNPLSMSFVPTSYGHRCGVFLVDFPREAGSCQAGVLLHIFLWQDFFRQLRHGQQRLVLNPFIRCH